MKKPKILVTAACVIALAALYFQVFKPNEDERHTLGPAAHQSADNSQAASGTTLEKPSGTKKERKDSASIEKRRNLEKEFDEILPANYPQQHSALCDISLKPGESVVFGGFKNTEGNYEFTRITVVPKDPREKTVFYLIKQELMTLTPEKAVQTGLNSLLTAAKTQIQNYQIVSEGESPSAEDGVTFTAQPTVIAPPDSTATVTTGTETAAFVTSIRITPGEDGDTIRLRARIESPAGMP